MLRGQLGTGRGNNVTDPLSSKERTTHWNMWDVLRNRAEDAHRAGNRGLAATLYQAAEELESSNLKTERMRTELQLQWERDESQRAEIERLARENEDFLDERQRRIHEILRLRAALDSLLTALNFRDSGERLFAVYGMPAIDAANAAAALLRDGCPPVETKPEPDVGALNRQLCEAEGHVFSRFAMHHCLRCEAAVTPGGYLAYTSQKASACPYGQSDCETTRGGVCQCAMPAEQASDDRD